MVNPEKRYWNEGQPRPEPGPASHRVSQDHDQDGCSHRREPERDDARLDHPEDSGEIEKVARRQVIRTPLEAGKSVGKQVGGHCSLARKIHSGIGENRFVRPHRCVLQEERAGVVGKASKAQDNRQYAESLGGRHHNPVPAEARFSLNARRHTFGQSNGLIGMNVLAQISGLLRANDAQFTPKVITVSTSISGLTLNRVQSARGRGNRLAKTSQRRRRAVTMAIDEMNPRTAPMSSDPTAGVLPPLRKALSFPVLLGALLVGAAYANTSWNDIPGGQILAA